MGIWRVGIAGYDDRNIDGMFPGDKKRSRESGDKPAGGIGGMLEAGGGRREAGSGRRETRRTLECGKCGRVWNIGMGKLNMVMTI